MSDLPAPLTSSDCDLRGFMEWTRFFGEKAFKGHWYRAAMKDPRGGIAALKLWWEAMLQCPAGSLPNDEEELAWLADFGHDIRTWRKHRATAMHGFVLCSDNRWYHPFVADEARKVWERRRDKEHERDVWRDQKRRQRANGTNAQCENVQVDIDRCPPGHGGGQEPMSSGTSRRTSASRAGLEEKETREEKKEPTPKSPPAKAVGDFSGEPPGFSEFYDEYPLKMQRWLAARQFAKEVEAGGTVEQIIAGVRRFRFESGSMMRPHIWLKNGCWKSDVALAGDGQPKPTAPRRYRNGVFTVIENDMAKERRYAG